MNACLVTPCFSLAPWPKWRPKPKATQSLYVLLCSSPILVQLPCPQYLSISLVSRTKTKLVTFHRKVRFLPLVIVFGCPCVRVAAPLLETNSQPATFNKSENGAMELGSVIYASQGLSSSRRFEVKMIGIPAGLLYSIATSGERLFSWGLNGVGIETGCRGNTESQIATLEHLWAIGTILERRVRNPWSISKTQHIKMNA